MRTGELLRSQADDLNRRLHGLVDSMNDGELQVRRGPSASRAVRLIDAEARVQPYPIYRSAALRAASPWMYQPHPVWSLITLLCIGHYRDHLTETTRLRSLRQWPPEERTS